jgi:aryl-alcohol dehydrogenase-like predicted oxidoreductase
VAAIERALELGVNWIDTAAAYGLGHSETIVRIGVSNFDVAQLRRADAIAPVETLQPPYSLAERAIEEEILPFAEREGIGVIAYSPLGSGLLTGAMTRERIAMLPENDWRKHDEHFTEPALSRHLATVERLETVVKRHDTTPGAVAIAWALSNPAVDAAIVGFRRPEQVDPLVPAANVELTPHDLAEIAAA